MFGVGWDDLGDAPKYGLFKRELVVPPTPRDGVPLGYRSVQGTLRLASEELPKVQTDIRYLQSEVCHGAGFGVFARTPGDACVRVRAARKALAVGVPACPFVICPPPPPPASSARPCKSASGWRSCSGTGPRRGTHWWHGRRRLTTRCDWLCA
jgi:hypothetical protein